MNAIATSTSTLRIIALVTFGCLTTGCTADVVGTGDVRRTEPGTNGGNTGASSGSGFGTADGTGSASDVPAEVEALFAPPEDDTVTPDSIFGVWASSASGSTEARLKLTKNSVTLARKCTYDNRIAYVTAKIRLNTGSITILEGKSAQLTGTCSSQLRVDVEEWRMCSSDSYDNYSCLRVDGTRLDGFVMPGDYSSSTWIKLSD